MLSYVERFSAPFRRSQVPDPVAATADTELLARVERALAPQYVVEGELGRGGMGIVYRARDTRLKRTVAVKLLPPELAYRSEIKSRFLREAEMAAQLSHPNIVPIYSVDEKDGLVYFIMACVEGDNLAKRMANARGPLPIAEVRKILREVSGALSFAHARKFIHRDIKPDNILLDADDGRAIVTDFGIARAVQDGQETRLTATGIAIGTPAYMSPEQCAGERELDGRADLYALGTLGYQMLAGRLPFEANSTPALLVKQLSEKPVPISERRPDAPADLAGIIMRLLEKEPSARFATADELSAALDGRISSGWQAPSRQAPVLAGSGSTQPSWAYGDGGRAPATASPSGAASYAGATSVEVARWYAPQVVKFRKGLAPFMTFAVVALVLDIVSPVDMTFVPAFWSIGIAMGYAKLWQAGYDWRDVFKQPRATLLADVISEKFEDVSAMWDPRKRVQVRERHRLRSQSGGNNSFFSDTDRAGGLEPGAASGPISEAARYGVWYDAVRDGVSDRAEIHRMIESLPKSERSLAGDIGPDADRLLEAVRAEAAQLADLDRNPVQLPDLARFESEITLLESQANPLEAGSEERVRRLAKLRREKRQAEAESKRRERASDRLEKARAALRSIRYDLVKLRSGSSVGASIHVTQLAERAQELARDVDAVLAAVGSAKSSRTTSGTR
jgi:eukaryotic-like serine/threonine-protein kinase